jgi:anti-sigma regulatory factor (Ser/Thr protein kinase)
VGTPVCEDTDVRSEVILPATKSAPMLARIALDEAIPPPELKERFEDARLAISEIVTNAVLYGGLSPEDTIRLVIAADDDLVRAEVEQVSSARDAQPIDPRLDDSERPGGFGLHIVEATADEWGVDPGPPGQVWFEFRR